LAAVAIGGRWLWIAVHVGAGYAAKVTCSLALNSGQDAAQVFRDYVSRARMWPGLPTDAYAARGHSGQYVVVVPSAKLVVVRLGLSIPDDGNDGTPELLADLIRALR
jgi:CubicO group peptidase (beta-lactamase class C family)